MESKCYQINTINRNVLNTTPLLLSRIASTCLDKSPPEEPYDLTLLKSTIPFLVFSLEISSNNLME